MALLVGCVKWKQNVVVDGVPFQTATVDANGFVSGYISADTAIGGRPCRAGWVHLHPNGTLAGFTAGQDIVLDRFTIPAGTWVHQNPQGIVTVCAFPRNVEIQGYICRGGVGGSEGVQAAFYPDGALKQFFAPLPVTIDGIPCDSSLFQRGIELYENGHLKSGTLASDVTIDRQIHHQGERIHLTPDAHLAAKD